MFEVGKKYKIEDTSGVFYTARITEETEDHISFIDLHGQASGLKKIEIKRWREEP